MRKSLLILGALAIGFANAQEGRVGINTDNPNATLEVTGYPTETTQADGIIAPRLTKAQLTAKDTAYTEAQKGALVYVTDITGNGSAKTTEITAIGYYYFDGSIWKNIVVDSKNIYNTDGTLTAKRTVTMGTNDLIFSGNGKIGVGSTTPAAKLDINTTTAGQGFKLVDGTQADGKVLTSDANGSAQWTNLKVPVKDLKTGKDFAHTTIPADTALPVKTNVCIDVPKGKWLYTITLPVNISNPNTTTGSNFVRLRWMEASVTSLSNLETKTTAAISPIFLSQGFPLNLSRGVITGQLALDTNKVTYPNNATTQQFCLWADNAAEGSTKKQTEIITSWNEVSIFVQEIQ